ncbi:MAG: hypothetical protein PWQ37_913 [Candidatus Petromonas sp.]|jgi:hypothetical protein|nr:hypothetical protein [Candidatus Petromonas sp.]
MVSRFSVIAMKSVVMELKNFTNIEGKIKERNIIWRR